MLEYSCTTKEKHSTIMGYEYFFRYMLHDTDHQHFYKIHFCLLLQIKFSYNLEFSYKFMYDFPRLKLAS